MAQPFYMHTSLFAAMRSAAIAFQKFYISLHKEAWKQARNLLPVIL
jgi:hypothetical protein